MKILNYQLLVLRVLGIMAVLAVMTIHQMPAQGITKPNEQGPLPGLFVNTCTGNLVCQRTDLLLPGRGISINATFTYNSGRSQRDWGFGHGWSFTYAMRYIQSGDTVFIERDDGRRDAFLIDGTGYRPPAGVYEQLDEYQTGKFRLVSKYGLQYFFDDPVYRHLTGIEDRNGNRISLAYAGGRLSTVIDPTGRSYQLAWNGEHLETITDPNTMPERMISFTYDESGNLTQVTDPAGHHIRYEYGDGHRLQSLTNRRGTRISVYYNANSAVTGLLCDTVQYKKTFDYNETNRVTTVSEYVSGTIRNTQYTFDETGRIIRISYPDAAAVEYEWDDWNNIIAWEDENGHKTTYLRDGSGNILKETDHLGFYRSYTYTADFSQVSTATNQLGRSWLYEYDIRGNLLELTDPAGNTERYTWDAFGNRLSMETRLGSVWQYQWNQHGYPAGCTDPMGHAETYSYDGQGNRTGIINRNGHASTTEYDVMNRPVRQVNELGFSKLFTYDANGNLTREEDYGGGVTRMEYDALDRLVLKEDAVGDLTWFAYDEAGNLIEKTDDLGGVTRYAYDRRNRLIEETDPLGHSIGYEYDLAGRCIRMTDKRMHETTYSRDGKGRLIAVTDPSGIAETFAWDACGNRIRYTDRKGSQFIYTYDVLNRLTGITTPAGVQVTYAWDAEDRRIAETDPDGSSSKYSYDPVGRLISYTLAGGAECSYTYDPVGNRIGDADANGNPIACVFDPANRMISSARASGQSSTYTYDPQGNILTETNASGAMVQYTYDPLNRLVQVTSPMGNQTRYTYDGLGNIATRTDPEGKVTRYTYDPLSRLMVTSYPAGSVERTYDASGNTLQIKQIGIGLGETTTRSYDPMDRMLTESIDYGPFTKNVSYEWDPAGNLALVTDPDGKKIRYSVNPLNQVTSIVDQDSDTTGISYDQTGLYDQITYPNGEWSRSVYQAGNRLVTRETRDSANQVIFRHDYRYDSTGQLTEVQLNGIIEANYGYTADQRLAHAGYLFSGQDILYGYDPVGNRLTESNMGMVTSCWYNPENRLVSQLKPDMSTINYQYDKNGNVIRTISNWGTVNYEYDTENRLTSVVYPPPYAPVQTFYSAEGHRLARFDGVGKTYHFPSLAGNLAEMDSAGNTVHRLNPGISFTDVTGDQPDKIYQHWDRQLSTRFFTGHSIVASVTFDYFGEILGSAGDLSEVDPGLSFAGNPIDWDPMFGAELMGPGYAPDIDQYFGNTSFSPWRDPEARQGWLADGLAGRIGDLIMPGASGLIGPEASIEETTENGSGAEEPGAEGRRPSGLCGHNWQEWITTGTEWVYIGCFVDKDYLPQKRLIFKYEKKQQQKEQDVTCWLEEGHTGHHRDSERNDTGRTRLESYKPPFYKNQKSGALEEWPDQPTRDREGRRRLEELNK